MVAIKLENKSDVRGENKEPVPHNHDVGNKNQTAKSDLHTTIKFTSEISGKVGVRIFPTKKQNCRNIQTWITISLALLLIISYGKLKSELNATGQQLQLLKDKLSSESYEMDNLLGQSSYTDSKSHRYKRDADKNSSTAFPLLAHYKGGIPESMFKAGGLISPWVKDRFAGGEFSLSNTIMKEKHGSVVIPESGLYFIYAQVYYLSAESVNSYSIVIVDERNRETVLSTCSIPSGEIGESSCFTGVARFLRQGEKLQLQQRERNRHILLRQGQTFLGIVLLSPSLK